MFLLLFRKILHQHCVRHPKQQMKFTLIPNLTSYIKEKKESILFKNNFGNPSWEARKISRHITDYWKCFITPFLAGANVLTSSMTVKTREKHFLLLKKKTRVHSVITVQTLISKTLHNPALQLW